MDQKANIAVLFGGCSPEYSVSLQSAYAVITHMDTQKYRPILIGISPTGEWLHFTGDVHQIATDTWHNSQNCAPIFVSPSRGEHTLLVLEEETVKKIYPSMMKAVGLSFEQVISAVIGLAVGE